MGTIYNGEPGNASRLAAITISTTTGNGVSPIVVTTSSAHDLMTGDRVSIVGVRGNTAANGTWYVSKLSSTTIGLYPSWSAGAVSGTSTGNGAFSAGGSPTATYLGLSPRVTLPDDGADLRTATAINNPNEDAKDSQAYVAERVGAWRVVSFTTGSASFSFAAKLASITTYDTDFNGMPSIGYVDVQPGDIVEWDFGPFLVTAGVNDLEVKLGYDLTEYGSSTGHAWTDGVALVTVKANTKVPIHLRNAFVVPASPAHGTRAYPSFRGYDAGGSNWSCDATGANYIVRVWRQN